MTPTSDNVAQCIRQNIEAIAKIEAEFNHRRTTSDRIADAIGDFSGSMAFVVIHVVFLTGWIVMNLGMVPGIKPWDPFPLVFLGTFLSIEAIFLSTFVLIKQSRMSQRADERAHLDLQINLLAEREMTLVLQMLQSICKEMGVQPPNQEIRELAEETSVEAVASELQKVIAEDEKVIS